MARQRDREEHRSHTYEDQAMSGHFNPMEDHPDDIEESDEIKCRYCPAMVYWGPHYDAQGLMSRRLFTASTKRPHDCGSKLDPDAFAAVTE